jgi:hypothetical protein
MQESTNRFRLKYLPFLSIFLFSQVVSAELLLLEPKMPDEWISQTSKDRFTLEVGRELSGGNYAILLGTTDVTALFHQTSSGEFQYTSTVLALPSGEAKVKVFRIEGKEWTEVGQTSLRILTEYGMEPTNTGTKIQLWLPG